MPNTIEKKIRCFYDQAGWAKNDRGILNDTATWSPDRPAHRDYSRDTNQKLAGVFGEGGTLFLNCGCGPFTSSALAYSAIFRRRVCADISTRALDLCREKLQEDGLYLCTSMANLGLKENSCDGTLCEHALYHVNRKEQERAVRELIRVTKPGRPIVIIYSNPLSPLNLLEDIFRATRINKVFGGGRLYFYRNRLGWWKRFGDSCDIEIRPFDPISKRQASVLLPSDALSRLFFNACKTLEHRLPRLALHLWSYPVIILRKHTWQSSLTPQR